MPAASLPPRCALTAPFHPYRRRVAPARRPATSSRRPERAGLGDLRDVGGVFSVALSLSVAGCPKPAPDGGRYPPPRLSGARTFLPPPQGRGAAFRTPGPAHCTTPRGAGARNRLPPVGGSGGRSGAQVVAQVIDFAAGGRDNPGVRWGMHCGGGGRCMRPGDPGGARRAWWGRNPGRSRGLKPGESARGD